MEPAEIPTMLKRFYIEARNVEEKLYIRNSIKSIPSGLDRFLSRPSLKENRFPIFGIKHSSRQKKF